MVFAALYLVGLFCMIACGYIIITRMNRSLLWKNLHIDLGMQPGMLIVVGGFLGFPVLNLAIGLPLLVWLLQNKPNWKD